MNNVHPEKNSPPMPSTPSSSDKIVSNSNIKKRLNLHVKRRLQETTLENGFGQNGEINNLSPGSSTSNQSSIASKLDKSLNSTNATNNSTASGGAGTPGRGGKRTRGKYSSSVSSVPEDECSRDGNSSCNDGHHKEKDKSPDILTMVLNEKKSSLLRNPDVVSFLDNIVNILAR